MGLPILILGESGSGKSSSMRNFEENEVCVLNVASKPLPFRKKLNKVNNASYIDIVKELKKGEYKTYIIDDSQYLLAFEMFEKAKEQGYTKFTDMALNFYNLIKYVITQLPDNVLVYFMHHIEETTSGRVKAKTVGKMLDEKLTVEGLFSIVLKAETDGERYYFCTKNDGLSTIKTPLDMFSEREIDNDLKAVDAQIREYYEI